MPSSVTKLQAHLPIQYMVTEPGSKYQISKKGIGYGKKFDFTRVRPEQVTPGPKYDNFVENSISIQSKKSVNRNLSSTFYNSFDKQEKICYHGMEKHFYLRETQGPGHYLDQNMKLQSYNTRSSTYSFSKRDRNLLSKEREKVPAGARYEPNKAKILKKEPVYSIGKQSRDVSFSKYNALHSELVRKGLQ